MTEEADEQIFSEDEMVSVCTGCSHIAQPVQAICLECGTPTYAIPPKVADLVVGEIAYLHAAVTALAELLEEIQEVDPELVARVQGEVAYSSIEDEAELAAAFAWGDVAES
jgi:uncharacterized OB-fold protein